MPSSEDHLTYGQLADLIERELGERPAISTLRSAPSASRRSHQAHSRLTAGMPNPLHPSPELTHGGRPPVVFSRDDVEAWLANHPRRQRSAWQAKIVTAANTETRDQAVLTARKQGLSWQAIAEAIAEARGGVYTKQAAQQRYGSRRS